MLRLCSRWPCRAVLLSSSRSLSVTPQTAHTSHRDTIKSFFEHKKVKKDDLEAFLREKREEMHVPDAAQLMYNAALQNYCLPDSQFETVVSIIEKYEQNEKSISFHKYNYSSVHFARLMYGLKMYRREEFESNPLLFRFLTALNKVSLWSTSTTKQSHPNESFNAKSFSMCLFGLQNLHIDHSINGPILIDLIRKFRDVAVHLNDVDPYSLSYMIHGVKSLDFSNSDVQELLAVIITKASHLKSETFTYQLVCNCFSGLVKNRNFASRESMSLLHILTERLRECDHRLDANLMGVFFFLLKDIDSFDFRNDEVLGFVSALTDKVRETSHLPSPIQISNMLYASKHMPQDKVEVKKMQHAVMKKAHEVKGKFSPRDLSKCVSSLKHTNIIDVQELVTLLTRWFDRGFRNRAKLNTQDMKSCLYGLRYVKCTDDEIRQLLRVFSSSMRASKHPIDSSSAVHAFHVLRSADCRYTEVQEFLTAIEEKIMSSGISLDKRQISIIYGLSYIKNPYPHIRPIISLLSDTLAPIRKLSPRVGFGFLGGLRGLSSEYPETLILLSRLQRDLEASDFELHHAESVVYSIRQAFSVLNNMSSEHAEVRSYLTYISNEMEKAIHVRPDEFQVADISKICECIYFMKNLHSKHPEVVVVAGVLAQCLGNASPSNEDVVNAIYGMQNLNSVDGKEITQLLEELVSRLKDDDLSSLDLSRIAKAIYGLKSMPADDDLVQSILVRLLKHVRSKIPAYEDTHLPSSRLDYAQTSQILELIQQYGDDNCDIPKLFHEIFSSLQK